MSAPADHAGEVALIPDDMDCGHRVWVRDDEGGELWSCPLCMYLEARAEVDSLRAEVERLTEQRGQAWEREGNAMARAHTAEADADSLRVTLAAVGEVADDLLEHGLRFDLNPTMNASNPLGYLDYIARMDNHARQIGANLRRLLTADPVSLADVRETVQGSDSIGNATSLGPCTSICDAASGGDGPRSGCFTPWCKCACHGRAIAARHAEGASS